MAKEDEYLEEAFETLVHVSADEEKRLEYEARQKAIRDYNTQIGWAKRQGIEEGMEKGIEAFILDNLEECRMESEIIDKLVKRFSLNPEDAAKYFQKYAKI